MNVKHNKPVTPGSRFRKPPDFGTITKGKSESSLTVVLKKSSGRNNLGRITIRHRGGGSRRFYRIIDFKRDKFGIQGKVASIEYDPNRTSFIALVNYIDGEKRYILSPKGLKVGDKVISGHDVPAEVGNALPLGEIPSGSEVHNIELTPGKGGQIVRAAGSSATLLAKEGDFAHISLPSGEVRLVRLTCLATVGQVSNVNNSAVVMGKAGRKRWLGRRPSVRGVAMNPVDHPLGGGEGKAAGGRHPCSPWGKPAKGYKTRKRGKISDKYIVKRRK